MGPTASGKSALAEQLATTLSAQLISADAFQVYRQFNIGTNKPEDPSRYRLIDIKDANDSYGVGEFVLDALGILESCFACNQSVIVVGGTGFYIRALFDEYQEMFPKPTDATRAQTEDDFAKFGLAGMASILQNWEPQLDLDWNNPARVKRAYQKYLQRDQPLKFELPKFNKRKICIQIAPDVLNDVISRRTKHLIDKGWVQEVESILASGVSTETPAFRAIGYSAIANYLDKQITLDEAEEQINIATRQYAKRQRAWLRKETNLRSIEWDAATSTMMDGVFRDT